jgi:hypothetical protein
MTPMSRRKKSALKKSALEKSDSPIEDAQAAGAKPPTSRSARRLWKVYSRAATVLSGVVALRLNQTVWQLATRKKPPIAPEHPDVDAREALVWAVLSGTTTELVKIAVSRKTAQYWVRSTGNLPPDMDPIDS